MRRGRQYLWRCREEPLEKPGYSNWSGKKIIKSLLRLYVNKLLFNQLTSLFVLPVTCCFWSPVWWIQHKEPLLCYILQREGEWAGSLNAERWHMGLWGGQKTRTNSKSCRIAVYDLWPCHWDHPAGLSTDPLPHGFLLEANKMKSWRIPSPWLAEVGEPTPPWRTDGVTTRYRKSSSSTRWIGSHFLV